MTDQTFTPAQSSQVSTLAKLADKWRVQAKQYDEAAKECYDRGDDDEGDMNDIEGSALFRCATELDTALKSLAAHPPAAPVETWDKGEHEGCGADSQRAYQRFSAGNARALELADHIEQSTPPTYMDDVMLDRADREIVITALRRIPVEPQAVSKTGGAE